MRTSRRMLKQVRRALVAAFFFSGCINLLMLATPLYTLQIFQSVVPFDSIETLATLTAITAAAIGACALLEFSRDMLLMRAALWLDHELGQHIIENGLKLGMSAGDMRLDANALEQFRAFLCSSAITPLFDAPWIPIFLCVLTFLNPTIGAIAAISALLLLLVALTKNLLTGRLLQESARGHERSEQWWKTVVGNSNLAGALGLASGAALQWERDNRAHISSAYSLGKRTSFLKALSRLIRIGSQVALYGVGALLIVRGEMEPGVLVASAILLARVLSPLEQLVATMKAAQLSFAAYRRLKALPADAVVPRVTDEAPGPRGEIKLVDVTYYHPGRKTPSLRNISLGLAAGECLGIVGPNGAGKSTLAAIIAGANSPTSGAADLDGIPIAKWQRGDADPPVGYFPDDPSLIEGTIHDNIARFRDATLMSVAQAAMRAGVHETIHGLPIGYDTPVGPGGSALALRERRAVALARAIHGKPLLVVLDEPEIGLDGKSLRRLCDVLAELKSSGIGLVIATQDPRLLRLSDQIVVLNNGAMQALGSSAEIAHQLAQPRAASNDRAELR